MFVARDNIFFMSFAKETPAYWKYFLYDILAMVKQLGIPIYLLTLLKIIVNRVNKMRLDKEELKNLSFQELYNLPTTKYFTKKWYLIDHYRKKKILCKYYALRIEF